MAKSKGTRILILLECTECRSNLNIKRSEGVSRYSTQPSEQPWWTNRIKKILPALQQTNYTQRN
jgi:ribosomal protein L33